MVFRESYFFNIFNLTIIFFIVSCGSTNTGFESNNESGKRTAEEIVGNVEGPVEVSSLMKLKRSANAPASTATQVAAKPNLRTGVYVGRTTSNALLNVNLTNIERIHIGLSYAVYRNTNLVCEGEGLLDSNGNSSL